MTKTITGEQVEDIAMIANCEVRGSYSGRAMYGETCFGFTLEGHNLMLLGFAIGKVLGDEGENLIDNARTDAMGLGTIVYFPRWQLTDYTAPESNSDDEEAWA